MTARCNAAGQFLSLLIFKDINKKRECGDGSPPRVRRVQEREIFIHRHGFINQAVHRTFPRTLNFKEGRSTFRCHTAYCSSPLLLQTAVNNNVTIICLPIHYALTVQPLDKWLFGALKSCFKNEAASWYHLRRLIGFAWSEVASVGVGVSAFESTGI